MRDLRETTVVTHKILVWHIGQINSYVSVGVVVVGNTLGTRVDV